jgi:GDPmannose 4,6-dehydratase
VNLEFVQELIKNIEKYRTKSGEDVFLLQASSSEMYGPDQQSPIIESTAHDPRSPYAEHKSRAHYLCLNARETKDLRIGTAILFNHESPRRPLKFVSRKISHGAFAISQGREKKLVLGNINVQRDWGYAPDYVEAMSLIAQSNLVDDFVLATGKLHSLEDMCRVAFKAAGLGDFSKYVDSDQSLFRTVENSGLVGVAEKAHQKLNWSHRVSFELMIEQMVNQESVDTPSSAVSM